jgi:hypothetical protein
MMSMAMAFRFLQTRFSLPAARLVRALSHRKVLEEPRERAVLIRGQTVAVIPTAMIVVPKPELAGEMGTRRLRAGRQGAEGIWRMGTWRLMTTETKMKNLPVQ